MRAPVRTIAPEDSIERAVELLRGYAVSSLLVVDEERTIGLVTRTDVIDELVDDSGGPLAVRGGRGPVASRMTRNLVHVEATSSVFAACRAMIEAEIHQLVAVEAGRPVGVLSCSDAVAAARDLRLCEPIGDVATSVSFTVGSDLSIRDARRLLARAEIGSLLVMDGRFPVGVFGRREQLAACELPPELSVEWAMNGSILILPPAYPLHRAAAQLVATRAEAIAVLCDGIGAGVVTPTDVCRRLARLG